MKAFAHEAGFDAWMTGAVFASLLSIHSHTSPQDADASSPLAAVIPHVGRINVSRSDFPYIALLGEDATPDRSHVLVLTQLSAGLRVGAVQGALGRAELGTRRTGCFHFICIFLQFFRFSCWRFFFG